jgi:Bifunctional DNA primase/polymerase, N-terminal
MPNLLTEALRLQVGGLSVIPILTDGTKRPAVPWKPYQDRLPTPDELRRWFRRTDVGLAIIAGDVSEGLEILDFDDGDLFAPWAEMVDALCPGLLATLPSVQTPSDGRHVYYRCPIIAGNQRLAQRLSAEGRPEVTIESRGEGGYAIAPPSPPACHPLRQPYVLLQGDLAAIPTITPDERAILLTAARSFNAYVPPRRIIVGQQTHEPQQADGTRPGDLFNGYATWLGMLEPHGWTPVGQRGEVVLWRRPGKRERGCSATTNYAGSDLFYVFSSNAWPFEPETAYSKFAVYALLDHDGDYHTAARSLAAQRFGTHRGYERGASLRICPATVAARQICTISAAEVARWHG